MTEPDQDLAAARLWAVNRCPYFASALFALSPAWRPGIGTFATDDRWRLYLDPACFDRWSIEEAGAVLVHEAHHVLRDHGGRAKTMGVTADEHHRFNIAADMEINDDLADLPLPGGGVTPEKLGYDSGELAEAYFDWLETWPAEMGWECGSGAHGSLREWDDPRSGLGVRLGEADLIRQQVAADIRAHQKMYGTVPAGLVRWADAFLEPTVDWRQLLASAVRGGLVNVAGAVDFSYRHPNRRTAPSTAPRAILPSLRQPVPRVAVVIDTSASMTTSHLEGAMAELQGVLRQAGVTGEYVTVLSCDTAVQVIDRVFSPGSITLMGGGGTDMRIGLETAQALRPPADVIVVMTDGLTPWPASGPRQRVIVAVLGDSGAGPPWAHTVTIPVPKGTHSAR